MAECEDVVLRDDDAEVTLVEVVLEPELDEDADVVEEVDDELVLGEPTQVPCITQTESSA